MQNALSARWHSYTPLPQFAEKEEEHLQERRSQGGLPLMDRGSVPEKEEVFNDCQGGGGTLSVNQS